MKYLLITSAAYVDDEVGAEFGNIPPAFLPLGNKRLYIWQNEYFGLSCDKVILTLPDNFSLAPRDKEILEKLGIQLLYLPTQLSLAESISNALNIIGIHSDELHILHGDTLFKDLNCSITDSISVHEIQDAYTWTLFDPYEESRFRKIMQNNKGGIKAPALSGYFCFSSAAKLKQKLALANGDFIKAINLYDQEKRLHIENSGIWLDFGHLQTIYQSRRHMTTERSFNNLTITKNIVSKSSIDDKKIKAESSWFENTPIRIKPYSPAFYGSNHKNGETTYHIGNLLYATLNELFVFGRLGFAVWQRIFSSICDFMNECRKVEFDKDFSQNLDNLYKNKTFSRLEDFCQSNNIDINHDWVFNNIKLPSLSFIAYEMISIIDSNPAILSIMHGDLCFSNIFYDFRSEMIKVIDPRGSIDGNEITIYGDQRYDIAKLHHSVIGLYDFIIAGFFSLNQNNYIIDFRLPDDEHISTAKRAFLTLDCIGINPGDAQIQAISILLFLSMLPLHDDNKERQWAFLSNALRLYAELKGLLL